MDEPSNEIDAESTLQLMALLKALKDDRIMLVTTHHLAELEPISTNVLRIGSTGKARSELASGQDQTQLMTPSQASR